MKLIGYLETLSGTTAKGWAALGAPSGHRQVELELLVSGSPVTTVLADVFRQDLADAHVGDGFHAFEIDLAEYLEDLETEPEITAREKSTGATIPTLNNTALVYRPRSQRRTYTLGEILLKPPLERNFALNAGDKLAIYASYTVSGSLNGHHRRQIAELHEAGYKVILSHAPGRIARIRCEADVLLLKKNIGHDFGSWWAGLTFVRERDDAFIDKMSALLLLNDSYFGAVPAAAIRAMEALDADVAGLTDSHQVEHHLQSYCLLCKGEYLKSGGFTDMLLNYSFPASKADVIHEGEIALSRAIKKSGGSIEALHDYDNLATRWKMAMAAKVETIYGYYAALGFGPSLADEEVRTLFHLLRRLDDGFAFNPSHLFWQEIIDAGTLIVKKELLLKNPVGVPAPGERLKILGEKGVIAQDELNRILASEKIAMHFA